MELFRLITQSGFVVQLVMLGLLLACLWTWLTFLRKLFFLNKMNKANRLFIEQFNHFPSLETLYAQSVIQKESPVAVLFKAGYEEFQKLLKSSAQSTPLSTHEGLEIISRTLKKSMATELVLVEKRVSTLATIGSTAPFVGLLGTVWGIMNAFNGLAKETSSTIAAVAPGIAEALIATAIGLFCAIPAVLAYNYFIGKIKLLRIDLNNFCLDFLNLIRRLI